MSGRVEKTSWTSCPARCSNNARLLCLVAAGESFAKISPFPSTYNSNDVNQRHHLEAWKVLYPGLVHSYLNLYKINYRVIILIAIVESVVYALQD